MSKRAESDRQRVLGQNKWAKGDINAALFHYQKAIEIDPSYDLAAFQLGIVYLELGDCDSAIAALCKTIKPYEDCAETFYYLGMAYRMKRDYGKAAIHFHKAIVQHPQYLDQIPVWSIDRYERANAYYWRGRMQEFAEKPEAADDSMIASKLSDSEVIGDVFKTGNPPKSTQEEFDFVPEKQIPRPHQTSSAGKRVKPSKDQLLLFPVS